MVRGITAATTGAIAGVVIVVARQSLSDLPAAAIAIGALIASALRWKVPEPLIVVAAALVGLLVRG